MTGPLSAEAVTALVSAVPGVVGVYPARLHGPSVVHVRERDGAVRVDARIGVARSARSAVVVAEVAEAVTAALPGRIVRVRVEVVQID